MAARRAARAAHRVHAEGGARGEAAHELDRSRRRVRARDRDVHRAAARRQTNAPFLRDVAEFVVDARAAGAVELARAGGGAPHGARRAGHLSGRRDAGSARWWTRTTAGRWTGPRASARSISCTPRCAGRRGECGAARRVVRTTGGRRAQALSGVAAAAPAAGPCAAVHARGYTPLPAIGTHAKRVFAFARTHGGETHRHRAAAHRALRSTPARRSGRARGGTRSPGCRRYVDATWPAWLSGRSARRRRRASGLATALAVLPVAVLAPAWLREGARRGSGHDRRSG